MANFEYIKDGNKYVFHYALDAVAADAPADDFSPKQAILVEVKKEDSDEKIAEYMAKFVNGQMTELKNTDGDVDVLSGNEDLGVKFMEAYTQKHTEAVQAARAESGRAAEDEDEDAEAAARLAAEQAAEQARIAGFNVAQVELRSLNLATQTVELNVTHAGGDAIHASTPVEATFEVAEDGAITFDAQKVEGGDYADAKNDAIEAVMKAVAPEGERPEDEDADGNQAAWDAAAATYELLDGVRDGITRVWPTRVTNVAIDSFNDDHTVLLNVKTADQAVDAPATVVMATFNADYTEITTIAKATAEADDLSEAMQKQVQDFYAAAVADSDVSNIHSRVLEAAKEVTGLEFVDINVVPNKTPHTATFRVTQKGYAEAIRVTVQLTNDAQAIQGRDRDEVPGLDGVKLGALQKLYADKVDGPAPADADVPAPKVDSEVKEQTLAAFNRQITSFEMDITAKGLKVMAWDAGANKLVPWTEAQHGAIESGDGARGALDKHFVREITAKFGDGKDQKDAEGGLTKQRSFSLLAYLKNGEIGGLLQLNEEGKHADFEGDKAALIIAKANADIEAGKQVTSLKLMSEVNVDARTAEVEVKLANGTKETLVATFDEHFEAITELAARQVPAAEGEGTEPAKSEIIGDRVAVDNIRAAHTAVVSEEDETLKFASFFQAVDKEVKTQRFIEVSTVEKTVVAAGKDEPVKYKVTFQDDADGLAGEYAGNVYEITENTPITVTSVKGDDREVITPNRGNARVFELLATVVCDKVDGNPAAKPEDADTPDTAARMRDALRNTANYLTHGNKYNVIGKRAQVDTAAEMAALRGMDAFKQGWKHPLYYTANFVKGLVGAVVGAAISAIVQPFATAAQEASRLRMRLVAVRKHAIAAKHGAFFDAKTNDYYTMEGEPAARANKTNEQLHALPLAENYKGKLAFRAARAIFWDIPKGVAVAVASAVMMLVRIALAPVEGIVYGVKDAIEANTSESILMGKQRGIVRALTMTFDRVKMLDRRGMKADAEKHRADADFDPRKYNPQMVRQTGTAKLSLVGATDEKVQNVKFFGKDLFVTLPLVLALIGGLSMAAFILFAPLVPAGIPVVSAVFAWVNTVAVPFLTGFAPLAFIASLGTVLQATALAGVVAAGTWAATYVAEVTLFAVAAVTKFAGQLLNVLNPFSADRADKTHMADVDATTPEAALTGALAEAGSTVANTLVEERARDEFSTAWNLFKASMRTWWNTPKELRAAQKANLQETAAARKADADAPLQRVADVDTTADAKGANKDALAALMVAAKDGEPAKFSIAKPDFDAAQRAYAQSYVSDSLLGGLVRTAAAALRTAAGNQEDMVAAHQDLEAAATASAA